MQEMTISPQDAAQALTYSGLRIGYTKLRAGLIAGAFHEFGFAIPMEGGRYEFVVFRKDLADYISSHGGDVDNSGLYTREATV